MKHLLNTVKHLLRDHPDNKDSSNKLCEVPYCCHNTHFTLIEVIHSQTPFFPYKQKLVLHIQTIYFVHVFILCVLSAHNYLGVTQTEADFLISFFSSQTEFMTTFVNQN